MKANLRPSTFAGYKKPYSQSYRAIYRSCAANQLTPAMLDNMFQQLFYKGLIQ